MLVFLSFYLPGEVSYLGLDALFDEVCWWLVVVWVFLRVDAVVVSRVIDVLTFWCDVGIGAVA